MNNRSSEHSHPPPFSDPSAVFMPSHHEVESEAKHDLIDGTMRLRRFAIETAIEPMFTLCMDGRIIDVNQSACRCIGYSRTEILDLNFRDITADWMNEVLVAKLERVKTTGVQYCHLLLITKTGQPVDVEVTARLFEFEDIRYVCVSVRDESEKRALEQDLELITDSVPAFIGLVDTDQTYQFVNAYYEQHYGLSRDEICGKTVRQLNGDDTYEKCRPYIEAALRGQNVQFEYVSPARKHYLIKYKPRIQDRVTGYYVISTDITAIKNAESELIKSERKLRQAHDQFKDLAILAHRDRLTSMGEMASAITHELNQPLMVISGMAHVLETASSQREIDNTTMKELSRKIADQAVQAGDIAHRMRGFASKKNQNRERCDLNSIVQEATRMLQPRLNDDNILLLLELDPNPGWISADPIQIQQVIVNLVLNAAEAMADQHDPKPGIQIITSGADPETVRVTIRDTGPGVPEEHRARIFEAFESTKKDGMGMGLAISRSLIENYNGKLVLDNDYEAGASFVMLFEKSNDRMIA